MDFSLCLPYKVSSKVVVKNAVWQVSSKANARFLAAGFLIKHNDRGASSYKVIRLLVQLVGLPVDYGPFYEF